MTITVPAVVAPTTIPQQGANIALFVNTGTPSVPVWTQVNQIDTYSRTSSRNTTKTPVFMKSTQYQSTGPRENTLTMSGLYDMVDPGQQKLLAAEDGNAIVTVMVVYDGTTNGFTQDCLVSDHKFDAKPDGYDQISFTLVAQNDPTVFGTITNVA